MKRVVLGTKTILAYGLTSQEALNLQKEVSNRKDLAHILKDRIVWASSGRNKNLDNNWYVYLIDETLSKAFLDNPESFIFEISSCEE